MFGDHTSDHLKTLANAGVHRFTYMADQQLEINGGPNNAEYIHVEVEYYMHGYEKVICAVRVWELDKAKRSSTGNGRKFLPSPNWLQEVLIGAINTETLPQGVVSP